MIVMDMNMDIPVLTNSSKKLYFSKKKDGVPIAMGPFTYEVCTKGGGRDWLKSSLSTVRLRECDTDGRIQKSQIFAAVICENGL